MARTITRAGAKLDVGLKRTTNEDYLGCRQAASDAEASEFGDLFVLADGMGGHAAGEIASKLAVETILSSYYAERPADVTGALLEAIQLANKVIHKQSADNFSLSGMGTTCVCCAIRGNKLYTAHVGDSRAYLLRDGVLLQITQDHSWVEEQVRNGLLTAEEARGHPMRNIITRALGNEPEVEVDLSVRDIEVDDTLIICSDGLTSAVEDKEIKDTLLLQLDPRAAADALIEEANDAGGPDNISVIVVRFETVVPVVPDEDDEPLEQHPKKGWTRFLPFT